MSDYPFPTFTQDFRHSLYPSINPTNPSLSARGKTVLITGGGRGIGKFIAESFAVAGAQNLILLGRTASTLVTAETEIAAVAASAGHTTRVESFAVDICDTAGVGKVFETVRREIGPVDVFVNNAGDLYLGSIEECDVDEFWKSFEVNVKGTLNCMQAFLRFGLDTEAASPATVINVSTVGIHIPPTAPPFACYASSKLAAWKMAEYLSAEMGDKLRVFSINPGTIATDMSEKAGVPIYDDKGISEEARNLLAET
jgi:NAD(P)-dependent dehydrogenase (short-subunit alcohol dehydrogenase family)